MEEWKNRRIGESENRRIGEWPEARKVKSRRSIRLDFRLGGLDLLATASSSPFPFLLIATEGTLREFLTVTSSYFRSIFLHSWPFVSIRGWPFRDYRLCCDGLERINAPELFEANRFRERCRRRGLVDASTREGPSTHRFQPQDVR